MQDDAQSIDEDLFNDDIDEAFKYLFIRWKKECVFSEKYREEICVLLQDKANVTITLSELKKEVNQLISKLEGIDKYMCMLNYGYKTLDEILGIAKPLEI